MKVSAAYLNQSEIEALHEATMRVLSATGVRFTHEKARELFKKHGARIDGENVLLSEALIRNALASVPRSFVVKGRDKEVVVGGGKSVFAPASGPVFVKRGSEKRLATTEDFLNFLKLSQMSKALDFVNYIVVEPQDMPEENRKLFAVASALKYSNKPLAGMTMGEGKTRQCLDLIRRFYGSLDDYRLLGIISPISPLVYDRHMLDHVFEYANANQPLMFASCSQMGATSPATIAGTLVVDNAQALAGIALSQLIKPGVPVLYGSTSTACDMRYVSPAIGAPETALITSAFSQLSKYYKLPCRSGGALTDAKLPDMQAGLESMMTLMTAVTSGVDFVLHALGIMDSFNTLSYEKFLIDEETVGIVNSYAEGFAIDEDHLAVDTICEVGSGEQYLGEEHTGRYYKSEQHMPGLFSREGYAKWESGGAPSLEERASWEIESRLAAYESVPLSREQESLLKDYL